MFRLRVKQCCYCCSLRTGTLLLLRIELICCILWFLQVFVHPFYPKTKLVYAYLCVLPWIIGRMVVTVYGIIGVKKERPSYLLPYLILCIVSVILIAVITILMCVEAVHLKSYVTERIISAINTAQQNDPWNEPYRSDYTRNKADEIYDLYCGIFFSALVVGFVLSMYFTVVVYSYYEQLRELNGSGAVSHFTPLKGDNVYVTAIYSNYPPPYNNGQSTEYQHYQSPPPYYQQNISASEQSGER